MSPCAVREKYVVAWRRCLLGLALAAAASSEGAAQTSRFPDRPIRMIVGFSAGGGTDVIARILAQKLSETLGQSVVVENRTGASGLIGGEAVAKSAADGYTLMMGSQTTFAVAPTLQGCRHPCLGIAARERKWQARPFPFAAKAAMRAPPSESAEDELMVSFSYLNGKSTAIRSDRHEGQAQSPYQVLRLPDERLRFPSYGGHARARGLCRDATPEDADLIILNTCHIREKAAEKVYSELGRMRVLKQEAARRGTRA